jgi:hypothetical protein
MLEDLNKVCPSCIGWGFNLDVENALCQTCFGWGKISEAQFEYLLRKFSYS